jgi:hypothetical protein
MSVIEIRLSHRQATLAGITRAIDQQLGRTPLARVELRYSTQARVPLLPQEAKQKIALLLRDHGHGTAAISVRPHEGPIDDATGEHLLRMMPSARAPDSPAADGAGAVAAGWRASLARWMPWRRAAPAADDRVEPGLAAPAPPPAVNRVEAVQKLRQAVHKGSGFLETGTGTGIVAQGRAGGSTGGSAVGQACVIVRLDALHLVLEPLVRQDPAAIGAMLRSAGLTLSPGFQVAYRFERAQAGDGTSYANESDVEVRLIAASAAGHEAPSMTAGRAAPVSRSTGGMTTLPSPGGTTALPAAGGGTALPARPQPAVTLRVLGTLDQPFDRPFEVFFMSLPARLDRNALERAGFGLVHPGLLPVASNSCPLVIQGRSGGEWQVQATARGSADGQHPPTPMYFRLRDRSPVSGPATLATGEAEPLLVNAPHGSICPQTGRRLPALVIELHPDAA